MYFEYFFTHERVFNACEKDGISNVTILLTYNTYRRNPTRQVWKPLIPVLNIC